MIVGQVCPTYGICKVGRGCRTCTKCNSEAKRLNASAFNDFHSVLRCEAVLKFSVLFFLIQYSFFWRRNQKKEYWCRGWGCISPIKKRISLFFRLVLFLIFLNIGLQFCYVGRRMKKARVRMWFPFACK